MIVFFDDILIIGKGSFEEHLEQAYTLKEIIECWDVTKSKSFWVQGEVEFLGLVISINTIQSQQQQIEKMSSLTLLFPGL